MYTRDYLIINWYLPKALLDGIDEQLGIVGVQRVVERVHQLLRLQPPETSKVARLVMTMVVAVVATVLVTVVATVVVTVMWWRRWW